MMLGTVFSKVVQMSFYGALAGILLLGLKRLLKDKLSPKWHFLLWLIVLVRLLLPFNPPSVVSAYNFLPDQEMLSKAVIFDKMMIFPQDELEIAEQEKAQLLAVEKMTDEEDNLSYGGINRLAVVWLVGLVIGTSVLIGQNWRFRRWIAKNAYCPSEEIALIFMKCRQILNYHGQGKLLCSAEAAPVVFGLWRSVILLPVGVERMNENSKAHILLHELCHLKNGHLWFNALWLAALSLHWFNPIVWICYKRMRRDMELACDSAVLNNIEVSEHKRYGLTLLALAASGQRCSILAVSDNYQKMEERIEAVKKAKQWQNHQRSAAIIGVICLCIVAVFLLTDRSEAGFLNEKWTAFKYYHQRESAVEETLYDLKTPYVGNASAVGKIFGALPYAEYGGKMAILEKNNKYYVLKQYDFRGSAIDDCQSGLYRNALLLLALVDNLDGVCYEAALADGTSLKAEIMLETQEEIWGDLKAIAQDEIAFEQFSQALKNYHNEFDGKTIALPADFLPAVTSERGKQIGLCRFIDETSSVYENTRYYQDFQKQKDVGDAHLDIYNFVKINGQYHYQGQDTYIWSYANQQLEHYQYHLNENAFFADTYSPVRIEEDI